MIDFMDMGFERPAVEQFTLPSKKQKAKAKKARTHAERVRALPSDREADAEARKEADFAKFLSNVGAGACALAILHIPSQLTWNADGDEEL